MTAKEKNKVVAYMRTNAVGSAEKFSDLYEQYEKIRIYTNVRRMDIIDSFEEIPEARRSKLYDILERCRSSKDISKVIAVSQSRIARDFETFEEWKSIFSAIGVKFEFVQRSSVDGYDGYTKEILTSLARLDSKNRSEYIKRGFLSRVQAGYSVQKPPKGYVSTSERGLFARDRKTSTHLRTSITRFLNGEASRNDLRRAVSILFSKDKLLDSKKFKTIVTNPYYAGYVCYGGKQYQGLHEPLLTVAEHKKLINLLSE